MFGHLVNICNVHEDFHCFCSLFFSVFLHSCWNVALCFQRQDFLSYNLLRSYCMLGSMLRFYMCYLA